MDFNIVHKYRKYTCIDNFDEECTRQNIDKNKFVKDLSNELGTSKINIENGQLEIKGFFEIEIIRRAIIVIL